VTRRRLASLVAALALVVVSAGPSLWAPASAGGSSGTVFLRTVPALGGVQVFVGGQRVTTGSDGSATVAVADLNGIASTVSLASSTWGTRHVVSLAMVTPAGHSAPHESHLTLGVDISSVVAIHLGRGTASVDPRSVRRVRLHSVTGRTVVLDPQRTSRVTLQSRVVRLVGGVPTAQTVTWSVDSLRAAPGTTVTTDRARFDPFNDATWALKLRPVQGTVVLDTVPATPGVTFLIDGASATTDRHGRATAVVGDLNDVAARVTLDSPSGASSTVELLRIARLKPGAPFERHLLAALAVSRPVSLRFTDSTGDSVPTGRVGAVQLVGGGDTIEVAADEVGQPVSLLAVKARLVNGSWTPQPVTYAVSSVKVEGADAVFSGQQRFNPNDESQWPISLSVFDVQVTVRDVLFGSLVSSMADVTRPDGVVVPTQLSADGPTTLSSLVRGEYVVSTQAAVVGGQARVRVSKDSSVELRVVTWLDALVLVGLVGVVGLSVVWLGRAWSRRGSTDTGGDT